MKITDIETIPVVVPISPDRMIVGARGPHDRSPFLLVRVHTDEGLTGLGEVSCTPRWSGEDSETARHICERYLKPRLAGQDPTDVVRLTDVISQAIVGHHFTKAAVEMALWDVLGKTHAVPLYRLLGGAARPGIRTKFSVAAAEPEVAAGIASWACDQGFTAMKVKVGTGLAADIARVSAVRAAIGADVKLGVDGNGGWSRADAAAAVAPLAAEAIAFIEQPVDPHDLAGLADIRRRAACPVVADESVGTPADALDVVTAGAADVLSIYVGMAGGIAGAQRAAAIAGAAGLGWTIGSNLELGPALAAHIHFAMATPGLADGIVPCDIISTFYYTDDILTEPLPIRAGWAEPPSGPGLGVDIDEEKLERYRCDA
ncbi:MAG TPA: enolase C-terminal domain-like protein [Streptosporangiaceae bacterium]|nr:enolase C-terminal domain-like protein [Streptosporangiaceae bacterium]